MKELSNIDKNNSEFISSIIHELRNPLNVIIGFSSILSRDCKNLSHEEIIDCAKEIDQVAHDMNELINDLLDIRTGEKKGFFVDLSKEIDVVDLIKRSVKLNYDYSLTRGITIKTEIADGLKPINLDAKRMKQILHNLISNALKYSPRNTEIKVSVNNFVKDNKNYLEITVLDQGFGMSEDDLKVAFSRYGTIANENSGKVDSCGLGLPITKELVELQNGEIEVKSTINKGSEFKLKFCYAR